MSTERGTQRRAVQQAIERARGLRRAIADAIADMLRADGENFTVLERMLGAVSDDLAQQVEENDRLKERLAELEAVVGRLAASDPRMAACIGGASSECRFCSRPGHWYGFETVEGEFMDHASDCLHLAARRLMGVGQ